MLHAGKKALETMPSFCGQRVDAVCGFLLKIKEEGEGIKGYSKEKHLHLPALPKFNPSITVQIFSNQAASSVYHFLLCDTSGRPLLPQGFVLFVARVIGLLFKKDIGFPLEPLVLLVGVSSCGEHVCSECYLRLVTKPDQTR